MHQGRGMMGFLPWRRRPNRGAMPVAVDGRDVLESIQERAARPETALDERGLEPDDDCHVGEGVNAMDDERMQILKMLEEQKITAEEAAKLLSLLDGGGASAAPERAAGSPARWFRVRVTDMATGRTKVNVNVPLDIVTAVGRLGARFGLAKHAEEQGVDLNELFESIRHGAVGKLVDVTDEEGSEHVEIYVE